MSSSRSLFSSSNVVAATAAAVLVGLTTIGLPTAQAAVADCDPAPNVRTWIGPSTGNWGTAGNWSNNGSQPPTPGADEVACIGDANVTLNVIAAEVDAVVSGPNGTLTMLNNVLTLSPSSGEESQVANLAPGELGGGFTIAGAGDMTVTTSFSGSSPILAGPAGSNPKLTLPASVGSRANLGSLRVNGRTLVVSDGVTVTQSAGGFVSSENGGSIENSGVWNATGDGAVFSAGTNPAVNNPTAIFHNTPTGVVRKTGGTAANTLLHPFDNDGLIENETTGTINLEGGSASSSNGRVLTGPGRIVFNVGTYTIGGDVSGDGTVHVNGTATFSGSYAVARTETGGGGSRIVFDTPSPQTLPQLVVGETVAGSADVVVTERFDCNGCRLEGAAGSKLTLTASVGTNATIAHMPLNGRSVVVEEGVTVAQSGGTNTTNGGSIENHGTWNMSGAGFIGSAPSVFRNMATGIVRRTAAAGAGATQLGPTVENDGLIENLSTGVLSIGPFVMNVPGKVGVLSTSANPALSGSGRLSPDVVQGESVVAPGSSAGTIEVIGAPGGWDMRSRSKLQIEIGGTGAGQFDKLALAGPFTMADQTTLALSTLPGYTPAAGDQIAIVEVEGSSVSGTFANVTGTDLGGDLRFQVVYEASRVLVRVLSSTSQPPNAVDDSATVGEDSGATAIDVLANDSDPNGDALTIASNTQPAHGTANCTASSCSYTPAANFNGNDSFTYRADDPSGGSDVATVNITVTPVNDPPTANDDSITAQRDVAKSFSLGGSDPEGASLTFTVVTQPAHGSVSCSAAGACTYTPTAGYSGPDSFTFKANDGALDSNVATISITVEAAVNNPPAAVNDSLATAEDTPGSANVLANDSDPDGDTLSVTSSTNGAHGTVSCTAAGVCAYTPAPGYSGPDSFTYTASDGHGGTDTATVTVTVTPVNDPPAAGNDSLTTAEDTVGSVDVLANDSDPDGDALAVTSAADGADGSVTCVAGSCSYTPNAGFSGSDSFTYTVSDGHGGTDTATVTVTVTPVNDRPFAIDDLLSASQNAAAIVDVLANDFDPDGDALSVTGSTDGAGGTVSCLPGGLCTYTPNAGFAGSDSFTYAISDGAGGSASARVDVVVTGADKPFLLVIDGDSIGKGVAPNRFSASAVNERIARIGLRAPLPAFAGGNVGTTLTLYTGEVGDEGWFALKTIPDSWADAGPTADGIANYLAAGRGLGSGASPEELLDKVPDVTPLRATGLKLLVGERVCAVVNKSDVSVNYGPLSGSLKGDNLGVVALEVRSATARSGRRTRSALPQLGVRVLDSAAVCAWALDLLTDGPAPTSSSRPFDVIP